MARHLAVADLAHLLLARSRGAAWTRERVVRFANKDAVGNTLARRIDRERLDDFMHIQPPPPSVVVYRWGG